MSENLTALGRQWFEEVWNRRRTETIDELMHPQIRGLIEGGVINNREEFKTARTALLAAFPDLHVNVEDRIGQGPSVVVRWTAAGTHTGAALGQSGGVVSRHHLDDLPRWQDGRGMGCLEPGRPRAEPPAGTASLTS